MPSLRSVHPGPSLPEDLDLIDPRLSDRKIEALDIHDATDAEVLDSLTCSEEALASNVAKVEPINIYELTQCFLLPLVCLAEAMEVAL